MINADINCLTIVEHSKAKWLSEVYGWRKHVLIWDKITRLKIRLYFNVVVLKDLVIVIIWSEICIRLPLYEKFTTILELHLTTGLVNVRFRSNENMLFHCSLSWFVRSVIDRGSTSGALFGMHTFFILKSAHCFYTMKISAIYERKRVSLWENLVQKT